jgi:hypothetical protein
MTTLLIWTDARDDNAWCFGTPHNSLPWTFTISEDAARELFDAPAWAEIKAIVRTGKVAQIRMSVDDIRSRTDTSALPMCGYCHTRHHPAHDHQGA